MLAALASRVHDGQRADGYKDNCYHHDDQGTFQVKSPPALMRL